MLALEGYLSLEVSAGLALTMHLGPNGGMEDVGLGDFLRPFYSSERVVVACCF